MKLRKLGRTGLEVSNLCLGAMTSGKTGWGCDEPPSLELVYPCDFHARVRAMMAAQGFA